MSRDPSIYITDILEYVITTKLPELEEHLSY